MEKWFRSYLQFVIPIDFDFFDQFGFDVLVVEVLDQEIQLLAEVLVDVVDECVDDTWRNKRGQKCVNRKEEKKKKKTDTTSVKTDHVNKLLVGSRRSIIEYTNSLQIVEVKRHQAWIVYQYLRVFSKQKKKKKIQYSAQEIPKYY